MRAYLLGPVAAVVLGGAALSGGLASPTSTWVAAFFVTILNQMLERPRSVDGVAHVVFGVAIILGMIISGDRIADIVGRLLLRRASGTWSPRSSRPPADRSHHRRNPSKGEYQSDTTRSTLKRQFLVAATASGPPT